jgi:hypothetical protein
MGHKLLAKIQPVLLLLLALQLFACRPALLPAPPSNLPVSIELDESFPLMVGQQGALESTGLTLQLQTVLNDWRCPSQVNCAAAGNATVIIDVWLAGQDPSRLEMNINPPPFEQEMLYNAYQIRLLKLDPYPKTIDQVIPQQDYRATFEVSLR